jgi:hypothetical protein
VKLSGGTADATLVNVASNGQAGTGEVFALTGTSPELPASALPGEGDGFAIVDLAAVGVRTGGGVVQFGVNTYGERAHPTAPAEFQVLIDTDRDGNPDFLVFNADLSLGVADGRNVVFVNRIGTPTATPFFFTDANLNSANAILTAPLGALGLAAGDQFDFDVVAVDRYFTDAVTDTVEGMTFTVGTPRYTSDEVVEVAASESAPLTITEVDGGAGASPSQTGMLVLWRDGVRGQEASSITVN